MARCRGCKAEINWMKTEAGRNIPLNPGKIFIRLALPDEKRTTIIIRDGGARNGKEITEGEAKALRERGGDVWEGAIAHWVTCPESDSFRKGRNSKGLKIPSGSRRR